MNEGELADPVPIRQMRSHEKEEKGREARCTTRKVHHDMREEVRIRNVKQKKEKEAKAQKDQVTIRRVKSRLKIYLFVCWYKWYKFWVILGWVG